jgi:hypothetical protein
MAPFRHHHPAAWAQIMLGVPTYTMGLGATFHPRAIMRIHAKETNGKYIRRKRCLEQAEKKKRYGRK